MLELKRVLAYAGLTGVLAAIAFAVPAGASFKGSCTIDGGMKMVDKEHPEFPVRQVGGQAKFTFYSLGLSCLADTNKDLVPEVLDGLTLLATGWYDNTVCGTGKAFGTVTSVTGPPKAEVIEGRRFAIQFVGNLGLFKWHDWDKPDMPVPKVSNPSGDKPEDDNSYSPAGALTLTPLLSEGKWSPTLGELADGALRGQCVKWFRLTGSFAVDFDG